MFVGAALLFALELLVGRQLLPYFGGGFHVWTTALMFFQGGLFLAYLYAHLLAHRLGRAHLLVVALPLFWLPPTVGTAIVEGDSVLALIARLTVHVACPFVVLATTAVVAQRWRAHEGEEPFGLYAVSNAGSLVGLFGYAFLIEPFFGLFAQRWLWALGFVVYVALAVLAWRPLRARRPEPREELALPKPSAGQLTYWVLLSAAPAAFLMAVTNLIALDAGSAPFVWVGPLVIYLGSFVWAFARPVPRSLRRLWPHVALVGLFFFSGGEVQGGWIEVAIQLAVLGVISLVAHGELYAARPPSEHLTRYYLVIALGGWLGGAFVALAAPAWFGGLYEYPIAVGILFLTILFARRAEVRRWLGTVPWRPIGASLALLGVILWKVAAASGDGQATEALAERRSFYGLYRVTRTERAGEVVRDLVSGNTRHGRQREGDAMPLSYYHPAGPLGDAFALVQPTRVAVVGLGVGAAAGHLRGSESLLRFFEIDPVVVELARNHFTYLNAAAVPLDVVVGDARVSLRGEAAEPPYDLLLIDAFAGDAIPAHLLTTEALQVDLDRVGHQGAVLLHVSNRYYSLRPVIAANARVLGVGGAHIARLYGLERDEDASEYVVLARSPETLERFTTAGWRPLSEGLPDVAAWTDDRLHTLGALRAVQVVSGGPKLGAIP